MTPIVLFLALHCAASFVNAQPPQTEDEKMECGEDVPLCGVLVIESGLAANGEYHQDTPGVHGLWPETGYYGTSQCISPTEDTSDPTKVYECYLNDGDDLLKFEEHEWEKHGRCAGVKSAEDYFTQICALADKPIKIMTGIKQSGGDLSKMSDALGNAGYAVFGLDNHNKQVKLSACASNDGKWVLAPVNEFSAHCSESLRRVV